MKNCVYVLCTTLFVTLMACETAKKENPILKEAGEIHNQAHQIGEGIEAQFPAMDSISTLLSAKKTPAADSLVVQIANTKKTFEDWETNIVTVPGMAHSHDHAAGDHDHEAHKPAPDVTPEQMLEIQKEMKTSIDKIKSEAEVTLARANALLKTPTK